jgi:hypothetical protein
MLMHSSCKAKWGDLNTHYFKIKINASFLKHLGYCQTYIQTWSERDLSTCTGKSVIDGRIVLK